jgi:hypothetical protein
LYEVEGFSEETSATENEQAPTTITTTAEPIMEPVLAPPPPPPPHHHRQVSISGEIVEEYATIRTRKHLQDASARKKTTIEIESPDMQYLDRGRLPVSSLPMAQHQRLKRIQGTPTNSNYRSTTGQMSSFAHLR